MTAASREARSMGLPALGVLLVLAASVPAAAEEAANSPTGAKTWIGRYAEIEEYLRTAPIERIVDVGEGVTRPRRAYFESGGLAESAIVKKLPPKLHDGYWESYKSEIAAYELDRMLGLDMVPVTVERRIGGELVSVQLWLPGCVLLREKASESPTRPMEWRKQVCRQLVFDTLVANIDRSIHNILVDEDYNLILIDHSRAFAKQEMPFLDDIVQSDRELFQAMKALDEETLVERLQPWLFGRKSIRDLLKRRDKIVEKLERLIEERGEAAVLPF
jgi:hypothetical protein